MHEDGPAEVARQSKRLLDDVLVMTVNRAEVLETEVLEQHLRLQDVLDALLDPVQRFEERPAHNGGARQGELDVVQHVLVPLRHPDRRQVLRQPPDRGLVGPAVVVHHDDDPPVLRTGDIVERLPGHAAGQGAVSDHRHDAAVPLTPELVGLREPDGIGQAGRGVRVLDQVVLGLRPVRVAGQAAALPERVESRVPAGQQLVDVGLVPGIEQDPVHWGIEDAVQGNGELHDAEVRAEVTTILGHDADEDVTNLRGQLGQVLRAEVLEISRTADALQQRH